MGQGWRATSIMGSYPNSQVSPPHFVNGKLGFLSMVNHKPNVILNLDICRSRDEGGEGFLNLLLKSGKEIMPFLRGQ
jgi:hypothetical protein